MLLKRFPAILACLLLISCGASVNPATVAGLASLDGTLKMDFMLSGEGTFTAKVYADAADAHFKDNPQAYDISTRTVSASDSIKITMKPGGGFAISFEPCK